MGYASYDSPHGPAGYDVTDICHTSGCDVVVDRGLAFLCGDNPISPEIGCGWWFCAEHLRMYSPDGADYLCTSCWDGAMTVEER